MNNLWYEFDVWNQNRVNWLRELCEEKVDKWEFYWGTFVGINLGNFDMLIKL